MAMGYVQANLVVLPFDCAFDFLLFCQRNPKPCPLLDVTDIGDPEPKTVARGADIRTDVPMYRVYRDGRLCEELPDIVSLWHDDFVGFLIGCSFTFENALLQAGIPVRHIEENRNVPMYITNRLCQPAGRFSGPMVVSMRPMKAEQAVRATEISSRFPRAHGAPVHFGDASNLGIVDLARPDFGEPITIHPDEIPVFWACGVTPQAVVMASKVPIVITHKPGHMFLTDLKDHDLEA
jgi:uncharacterized protein YcsI (UPF0317 family)